MKSRIVLVTQIVWAIVTVGLAVYVAFVCEPADQAIALRTLGLGLGAALISVPVGGLLAWVSLGQGLINKAVLLATICLILIPIFLHVSTWDAAFGRLGWLTSTEGQVLVPLVSGWQAAIWIHGIAAAPQVALLMLLGVSSGRRVFEEQALLDTSRWGVFWNVTSKRLWPLLILSVLWTMIVCAREIAATDLYQIGTLAEQIYLGYSLGQFNSLAGNWTPEQLAAAGNLNTGVTVIVIGWLAATASWIFMRLTNTEWRSENWRPLERFSNSGIVSTCVGVALMLLLVAVPGCNLLLRCCYFVAPIDGVPIPGYSLLQLVETIGRAGRDYTAEFGWSILIAGVAATVILTLGLAIAWLARSSIGWQTLFAISLAISCAVPGPLMGTLINRLFSLSDNEWVCWLFDRTICAPVMASVWFCWPLAPLVIWFTFRKIARDAIESSQLDGAGGIAQFFRLGLAGNVLAVTGCWLISFAFCFGELSASHLVLPPGIDTVPRLMLGLLHAGVDEMTSALTIVMVGLLIIVSLIGWGLIWLNRSASRRQ